jgi:antitoxin HicB
MLRYSAQLEPDKERAGFVVTFPDFEWGVTQGGTEAEALEMAVDALAMIIGDHIERGIPLPRPSTHRSRKFRPINLPALQTAKTELYDAFVASGIRKTELTRRLGIAKANVDRLFDLGRQSRLNQIEAAFAAIGKRLLVHVEEAA